MSRSYRCPGETLTAFSFAELHVDWSNDMLSTVVLRREPKYIIVILQDYRGTSLAITCSSEGQLLRLENSACFSGYECLAYFLSLLRHVSRRSTSRINYQNEPLTARSEDKVKQTCQFDLLDVLPAGNAKFDAMKHDLGARNAPHMEYHVPAIEPKVLVALNSKTKRILL